MPKICKADGCNNPVFSHGYCRLHGYLRTDSKKPKPIKKSSIMRKKLDNSFRNKATDKNATRNIATNSLRKKRYTKSVKIKHSSTKRKEETVLYEQAKKNVRERLQEESKWKCFFSGIDLPDDYNIFHHLLGKEGSLLYDEDNIRPAIMEPHNDYHHKTVQYLIENTFWYVEFIKRIYLENPDVFAIEARRIMKSGLGVRYIAQYFGELVNKIHHY